MYWKWSLECVQVYHCEFIHSSFKGPFESVIKTTKTPSWWHEWCAETCWRIDTVWRIRLLHAKLVPQTKYLTPVWGHPRSKADRNTGYPQKQFFRLFLGHQTRIFIIFTSLFFINEPMPGAARSKTYVCYCLLAGIVGSNSAGGMVVCLLCMLCGDR